MVFHRFACIFELHTIHLKSLSLLCAIPEPPLFLFRCGLTSLCSFAPVVRTVAQLSDQENSGNKSGMIQRSSCQGVEVCEDNSSTFFYLMDNINKHEHFCQLSAVFRGKKSDDVGFVHAHTASQRVFHQACCQQEPGGHHKREMRIVSRVLTWHAAEERAVMVTYEGYQRHVDLLLEEDGPERGQSPGKTTPWDTPTFLEDRSALAVRASKSVQE